MNIYNPNHIFHNEIYFHYEIYFLLGNLLLGNFITYMLYIQNIYRCRYSCPDWVSKYL